MRHEKRTELQKILQAYMAEEFKQYRQQHGLSQEGLARKLKISVRTYVDLEHGETCPSAATLATYLTILPPEDQKRFLEGLRSAWEE